MLSKCANPLCTAQFLYLHEGKLFRIELFEETDPGGARTKTMGMKPPTQIEFYWLCEICSQHLTVARLSNGGISVTPAEFALQEAS